MSKNNKYKSYKLIIILTFFMFLIGYRLGYADTLDCTKMPKTMAIIQEILGWVKIVIPILLILLGTVDFVKAIVAKDDDQMKKAQGDFVKRLIIGIVIFFVPMILRFILNIAGYGGSCLDELLKF